MRRPPYLRLTRAQRINVARMVLARWTNTNRRMQQDFDEHPETWLALMPAGGNLPRHQQIDGDTQESRKYREETIWAELEAQFGDRKAMKDGWGIGRAAQQDIDNLVVQIYRAGGYPAPAMCVPHTCAPKEA